MVVRGQPAPPTRRGPATLTDDGCAVEVYAALPPAGEAELVHAAVAADATVIELGCGPGRIADPLAALGRSVVGVDSSAAMLGHLHRAEAVRGRIEDVHLGEFGGVLLASILVNTFDVVQRAAFLASVRRHLTATGTAVLQRLSPTWADDAMETA